MKKLKTLKDIYTEYPVYSKMSNSIELVGNPTSETIESYRNIELVSIKNLKQKAIKMIKYFKMNHRQGTRPCEALMLFLNIKEEDLI